MNITLRGEELTLLHEKGIYWKQQSMVILSDLHLGKAGHFRKNGIPIPLAIHHHDLDRIDQLILKYLPAQVLFLGDLFHSDLNAEWWNFISWLQKHDQINFILVKGNHDIIPQSLFEEANIRVIESLKLGPFSFTHIKEISTGCYNLSGHVHPGVRLVGSAKQSVMLSCFHFSGDYGILPAFGNFTGIARVIPAKKDRVFVVTDDAVIDIGGQINR
jgi:DNA ligase-associated metallophosphoesterase